MSFFVACCVSVKDLEVFLIFVCAINIQNLVFLFIVSVFGDCVFCVHFLCV